MPISSIVTKPACVWLGQIKSLLPLTTAEVSGQQDPGKRSLSYRRERAAQTQWNEVRQNFRPKTHLGALRFPRAREQGWRLARAQ
jgi:hypothetical protein